MTFEPESAHHTHDALVIAAFAAGDLVPNEAQAAERRVRDCRECAALHADLTSLSAALSSLPKTAKAPRDFRLSPAQAAQLRGGPWWRRLAGVITTPRGIGRPLATAFTTLGLVGLLIGSLPGALPLAAVTGDRLDTTSNEGAGAPALAPSATPSDQGYQLSPQEGSGGDGRGSDHQAGGGASPSPDSKDSPTAELATTGESRPGAVAPVFALAGIFLAIGLGLFAVRRFGRRLA